MDAMFASDEEFAQALGELLKRENASRVRVLDVSALFDWTRYVILADAASRRQLQGLLDVVEEFLLQAKKERLNRRPAPQTDWALWDCGSAVIHLFLPETRDFYDLDRLYRDARVIYE